MYFYILDSDRSNKIKIGITERSIEERFFEHMTTLPRHKYALIIKLGSYDELKGLEDYVLHETREYNDLLWMYPNNECRFDITAKQCTDIAVKYLHDNNIGYTILDDNFIRECIINHHLNITNHNGDRGMNLLKRCDKNGVDENGVNENVNSDENVDGGMNDNVNSDENVDGGMNDNVNSDENGADAEKVNNMDNLSMAEIKNKPFPFELRGFQLEYYENMRSILENNDSLRMTVLCRCGKTVLFMKYLYDHMPDLIVYVASKLTLIGEVNDRWEQCFDLPIQEISSSGSEYVSDDVKHNLGDVKQNCILTVCNKSFHKLRNINLPARTVFVFDEAHELVYNLDNDHPLIVLNDIWVPEMKKIFVTATPVYSNRTDSNKPYMNMPEYYGENELKFTDIELAMEQKFMSPMKTIIAEYQKTNNAVYARLQCIADIIDQTDNENEGDAPHSRKVLIYTNSVENIIIAESFMAEKFPDYNIYTMHSGIKTSINAQSRKSFSEDKEDCMLINCKMVVAGINIADIDTVALLDPRNNKEDIIQIMFRPRSFCSDYPSKIARMIIPQEVGSEDFNTVKMVISELMRNNDPSVVKTKKDIDRSCGEVVGVNLTKLIAEINENVTLNIGEVKCDKRDMGVIDVIDIVDDVIMLIMGDYKFHTVNEVYDMLIEQGLDIFSKQKIAGKLSAYVKKGVFRIKYNNKPPHLYYRAKPETLISQDFMRLIRENKIDETEYPSFASNDVDYLWCLNPEKEYPAFKWRFVNEEYGTEAEIRTALEELRRTDIYSVIQMLPMEERVFYLREVDPSIPLNIAEYGISLD